MILNNITKESVLKAIEYVKLNGIPLERNSTKFALRYNEADYPPKYIISIANKYANGEELDASEFSGGREVNSFLKKLGFTIVGKNDINSYPVESFSWKVLNKNIAVKKIDKSVLLHAETIIPEKIRFFFSAEEMSPEERHKIMLVYKNKLYSGNIKADKRESKSTKLSWESEFAKVVRGELSDWYKFFENDNITDDIKIPNMYFKKDMKENNKFIVEFIDSKLIYSDITIDDDNEISGNAEGNVKYYYGKRYERDPVNREKAIAIHGTICCVCKFDFEEYYGERGKGYIEIHHVRPLSTLDEEIVINPETDLVPVCSNCHKMIYRYKDRVLEIEELKSMLKILENH